MNAKAIENLYNVFSLYPLNLRMEGCPCCVTDGDKEQIHLKQLRQLNPEDLSRYTFKAMTTWGDTTDFKHFLPRILELMTEGAFHIDISIITGKLEYGKWRDWPQNEQEAIIQFIWAWWSDIIRNTNNTVNEAFMEIWKLTRDMDHMLRQWKVSMEDNRFFNYVDFVYNNYNGLTNNGSEFRELDNVSKDKLRDWIRHNAHQLESGFFHFADKDNALATMISSVQYQLEHS